MCAQEAEKMSDRSLAVLEEFYLALSDGTRLRLLSLMQRGEVSVGYLSEMLDQSQPKISRHLAYLRSAGLVETRRDGKWIYYHIAKQENSFALRSLTDALAWTGNATGERTLEDVPVAYTNNVDSQPPEEPWETETETAFEDRSDSDENYSNEIEVFLL